MQRVAVGVAAAAGTGAAAMTFPWSEIFTNILKAGGVPPALFMLALGGLGWAIFMWRSAEDRCRADAQSLTDKRLEESVKVAITLERTTTALAAHTVALESRTETLNEVVKTLAAMAAAQEKSREFFGGYVTRSEETFKAILAIVTKLDQPR